MQQRPGTRFNSETDLDTVLDKTSFQGYCQFLLEQSLAQNSQQPLKEIRCFKDFSSTFVRSHQPKPPSRYFLKYQEYKIHDNVIYQDTQGAIKL